MDFPPSAPPPSPTFSPAKGGKFYKILPKNVEQIIREKVNDEIAAVTGGEGPHFLTKRDLKIFSSLGLIQLSLSDRSSEDPLSGQVLETYTLTESPLVVDGDITFPTPLSSSDVNVTFVTNSPGFEYSINVEIGGEAFAIAFCQKPIECAIFPSSPFASSAHFGRMSTSLKLV